MWLGYPIGRGACRSCAHKAAPVRSAQLIHKTAADADTILCTPNTQRHPVTLHRTRGAGPARCWAASCGRPRTSITKRPKPRRLHTRLGWNSLSPRQGPEKLLREVGGQTGPWGVSNPALCYALMCGRLVLRAPAEDLSRSVSKDPRCKHSPPPSANAAVVMASSSLNLLLNGGMPTRGRCPPPHGDRPGRLLDAFLHLRRHRRIVGRP